MDLQAIYESISSFWNQISPILIAHLIFLIAWLWLRKSNMNLLEPLERVLRSETYGRWKIILDEFNLMSNHEISEQECMILFFGDKQPGDGHKIGIVNFFCV